MKAMVAMGLLFLGLMFAGFAAAGDVASSEATGVLGVGADSEDEGDQGLNALSLASESPAVESAVVNPDLLVSSVAYLMLITVFVTVTLVTLARWIRRRRDLRNMERIIEEKREAER